MWNFILYYLINKHRSMQIEATESWENSIDEIIAGFERNQRRKIVYTILFYWACKWMFKFWRIGFPTIPERIKFNHHADGIVSKTKNTGSCAYARRIGNRSRHASVLVMLSKTSFGISVLPMYERCFGSLIDVKMKVFVGLIIFMS